MTTTEAFVSKSVPHIAANVYDPNSPAVLEPYIHRSKTAHLAEDLLLASLGSDGLSQKLANFTRVEMVDITPDA